MPDETRRSEERRHPPAGVHIRRLTESDLPAAMRLKELAGWNQTEEDWQVFLCANPEGCFAAESGDRVVGTSTTLRYGKQLGWLSMVLVHPDRRREGIGSALVRVARDHLQDCSVVGLDATRAGSGLYRRLGFREAWPLERLLCPSVSALEDRPEQVLPLRAEHMAGVAALDEASFGVPRPGFLQHLRCRAPHLGWARIESDRPNGFCLGRPGSKAEQIGPLVAETTADAIALCTAALGRRCHLPALIDVPAAHQEFRSWLAEIGFEKRRTFTRMFLGEEAPTAGPGAQFAVAGPEFG